MKNVLFFTAIILIFIFNACSDNSTGNEDINHTPQITSLVFNPDTIETGATTALTCNANDSDGDNLTFVWEADFGTINGSGNNVNWISPNTAGAYYVRCKVVDGNGGEDVDSVKVTVYSIVEQTFVVDSRSGLNSFGGIGLYDTEFYVKESDSLIIEANGGFYNGLVNVPDANGFPGPAEPNFQGMLPNIAGNSLIGSIGFSFTGNALLDDGLDIHPVTGQTGSELGHPGLYGPGFVGTSFSVRISSTSVGKIYFAINDSPLDDNSGNIIIKVQKLIFTE